MTFKPMQWIDQLPEVGDPIRQKQAEIARLLDEAADLEAQAKARKADAYRAGLALMSDCRRLWSDEEIRAAQDRAGRQAYTPGQRFTFTPGQPVNCNGYPGTVMEAHPQGMVTVRLAAGPVCVSASYPDCYPV